MVSKRTKTLISVFTVLVLVLSVFNFQFVSAEGTPNSVEIFKGLVYTEETIQNIAGKNVNIFRVTADVGSGDVSFATGIPDDTVPLGKGKVQTTTGQAKAAESHGKTVYAAVNGDFFNMDNDDLIQPIGIVIKDSMKLTEYPESGSRSDYFFGITYDGRPVIGDINKYREIEDQLTQAIGGGPLLVEDGLCNYTTGGETGQHPRTLVGITADNKVLMVVADGRTSASNGFSYPDAAKYMQSLGAVFAMNLDGGGSTTLAVKNSSSGKFDIKNHPSDGGERKVGNTLLAVKGTGKPIKEKTLIDTSKVFDDMYDDQWFKEAIDYAYTYKIMNGVSDIYMNPYHDITRAQFVQILANLEKVDTSNYNISTKFKDVPKGKWFSPAVRWASDNKIVEGISATQFNPNATLTRENMCLMLTRYLAYKKITLPVVNKKIIFDDDSKIGKWAYDAVYKCQGAGVIQGIGKSFKPKNTATRAQVATVFTILHSEYLS